MAAGNIPEKFAHFSKLYKEFPHISQTEMSLKSGLTRETVKKYTDIIKSGDLTLPTAGRKKCLMDVTPEKLYKMIADHPNGTLAFYCRYIAENFNVQIKKSAMSNHLKTLKVGYKKNRLYQMNKENNL